MSYSIPQFAVGFNRGGACFLLVSRDEPATLYRFITVVHPNAEVVLRQEYLEQARARIADPDILINLVSRRVKQLKYGMRPLVESLEKLEPEDIALREIIEGKIDYELYEPEHETA